MMASNERHAPSWSLSFPPMKQHQDEDYDFQDSSSQTDYSSSEELQIRPIATRKRHVQTHHSSDAFKQLHLEDEFSGLVDKDVMSNSVTTASSTSFDSSSCESSLQELPDLLALLEDSEWDSLYLSLAQLHDLATPDEIRQALSTKTSLGETPLHVAFYKAPTDLAQIFLMLIKVVDANEFLLAEDQEGNTPLHLCCAHLEDVKTELIIIKSLVALAPQAVCRTNDQGDTPLHLLVASPAFHACKKFVSEAAAEELLLYLLPFLPENWPQLQNFMGLTLLHIAIAHHVHERVLVCLLEHGPHAACLEDNGGRLPWHYVAAYFKPTMSWMWVRQLRDAFPYCVVAPTAQGDTALHVFLRKTKIEYADRNTFKLVEMLAGDMPKSLSEGEVVDEEQLPMELPIFRSNEQNLTPLHVAALCNTAAPLVKLLMDHAALFRDVISAETTPQGGATALHLACSRKHLNEDLVRVLATPAACQIRDHQNRTPLIVALQNKHTSSSVIKIVCKTYPKAAKEPSPSSGLYPLHYGTQNRRLRPSALKGLLRAAPEVISMGSPCGNLPLHEACHAGACSSTIEFLLEKYPAAIVVTNDDGDKPIDLARSHATQHSHSGKTSVGILKVLEEAEQEYCARQKPRRNDSMGSF